MYDIPDYPETWRDIPGHLGYQISTLGRVKSLRRKVRAGSGYMTRPERIKSLFRRKGGYLAFIMHGHFTAYVGPMVLLTFVGPKPTPQHQCAHGNGVSGENHLSNLRWATSKENHADRIAHGNNMAGEENPAAKLDWDKVAVIRGGSRSAKRLVGLARDFGVSRTAVRLAATYRTWKNAPAWSEVL